MPETVETLLWIAAVVGAVLTVVGGVVAIRRLFKRLDVIGEGVLGKPEVRDFSGAIVEEAVPSLQARVSTLEGLLHNSNQETRLTQLEAWREDHTRETDVLMTRMMDHILGESEGK